MTPIGIKLSLDGAAQVEDGLRRVNGGMDAIGSTASRSLGKVEMSANATAAALRNVPAQFTDIVVSLQSGQAPLTVFLQQGGQLKDMFGGAGNAARALGGYVLGLVNPFTVAAAAVGVLGLAYHQGSQEGDAYAKSIALTGNAAGTTTTQLQGMAMRIGEVVGTQAKAADVLAQMVSTGRVSAGYLEQFSKTAVELERVVGVAVKDTVKDFAELGREPVEASKKLNEQYNYLTASVYGQVKALKEQGDELGAVALAQTSYEAAMDRVSTAMVQRLGYIERGWNAVKDAAKAGWDAILNVGRPDTTADRISTLQKRLAQMDSERWKEGDDATYQRNRAALGAQLAALQGVAAASKAAAEAEGERVAAERAGIAAMDAVDKRVDRALTQQERLRKELKAYHAELDDIRVVNPNDERLNPANVAKVEAGLRKQYTDKGAVASAGDAANALVQSYRNADREILAGRKQFYTDLENLQKLGQVSELDALDASVAKEEEVWGKRAANFEAELAAIGKKTNSLTEQQRVTGQLRAGELEHQQTMAQLAAKSQQLDAKSLEDLEKRVSGYEKAAAAAREQVRVEALESKEIGVVGAALGDLKVARVEDIAAQLEWRARVEDGIDVSGRAGNALRAQAQAVRDSARISWGNDAAKSVADYTRSVKESSDALQFEVSVMGLSSQAREVAIEQYRIEIDLQKQLNEIRSKTQADPARQATLIAEATSTAAIAKANAANRVFLSEWQQSVRQYDDIFRQGFADMLNNGQDGWKSFTKSLVTTFKTTVADQIYKMFLQPVVVRIVGQLMGITGGGSLGQIGQLASGGGADMSWLTNFGGNAGNLLNQAGGKLFNLGLENLGATLIDNSASIGNALGQLGDGLGYLNSIIALSKGNYGQGIGSAIGTYFGGPIGSVIGSSIGKLLDKAFAGETRVGGQFAVAYDGSVVNQRRGQTYTYVGQQYDRDFSGGQRVSLTNGEAYRLEGDPVDASQEDAIRKAISGTAMGINDMLKALGSAVSVTGFWAGLETSEKGRGGWYSGGKLSNGNTFGESGQGDNYAGTLYEAFSTTSPDFKAAVEGVSLDLKQSAIQALQSVADIPSTIKKMVEVDAEALTTETADALLTAINAQIVGVNNFKASLDAMGLDKLADLSFDAASGIAELSGGFDKLQTNLSTYYENFYSEEERKANMQRQLRQQLEAVDIKLPDIDATDARAQYRALIEAQDLNTDAGRKAYAVLLQLAGAFAGLTNAADDSVRAAQEAAQRQQTIADKGRDLEQRLLIAQGKEREALDLRRLQEYYALLNLNPALAAMVIEIYKAEDAAEALTRAQQARETAYSRLQDAATLESERINAQLEVIDAQRTAIATQRELANESLSIITGVFDLVRGSARDLYGEVESTAAMQAAQGRAFVQQSLSNALATGYLPDQAALQEAIGAARGGINDGAYASKFEQDRDRLVLAGQLSQLEAVSGAQKSVAEQQLAALDAQTKALDGQTKVLNDQLRAQQQVLDFWRRQIDIANGTFDATLTVAEAVDRLAVVMGGKPSGQNVNTKAPAQINGGGASWGGGSTSPSGVQASRYSQVMAGGGAVWYEPVIDQALIAKLDAIAPLYHSYDGTGDLRGLLEAVKAAGGTMADLSVLSGFFLSDWVKAGATVGVQAFANGGAFANGIVSRPTNFSMGQMGEAGPEAIMPLANIGGRLGVYAMGGGQSDGEMLAELRALLAQNARLETRLAAIEGHTQNTARAANGNPDMPVPVAILEDETA